MIKTFLTNQLRQYSGSCWFQHDNATAYAVHISIAAVQQLFWNRVVSRN